MLETNLEKGYQDKRSIDLNSNPALCQALSHLILTMAL